MNEAERILAARLEGAGGSRSSYLAAIYRILAGCDAVVQEDRYRSLCRMRLDPSDDGGYSKPVIGHWSPQAVKNASFKHSLPNPVCRPKLKWNAIHEHLQNPLAFLGITPAFVGICVLDIDPSPDLPEMAVERVIEEMGEPLEICSTMREGGWHLIYPVRTWDDALEFTGGQYSIDGIAYGEVSCARRISCLWNAETWERAISKRDAMDSEDEHLDWLRPEGGLKYTGRAIGEGGRYEVAEERIINPPPPTAPKFLREAHNEFWVKPKERLETLISLCDMKPDGNGSWVGQCPCGERSVSGTRFLAGLRKPKPIDGLECKWPIREIAMFCRKCGPELGYMSETQRDDVIRWVDDVKHRADALKGQKNE